MIATKTAALVTPGITLGITLSIIISITVVAMAEERPPGNHTEDMSTPTLTPADKQELSTPVTSNAVAPSLEVTPSTSIVTNTITPPPSTSSRPVTQIETPEPTPDILRSNGMLILPNTTTLFAPRKGKIAKIVQSVGAPLTTGDVILEFDCADIRSSIEEQRLEHHSAKLKKQMALKDFIVGEQTKEELNLAELNVEIALSKLNRLRLEKNNCQVAAPFDSHLITLHVHHGELIDEFAPLAVLTPSKIPQFELWVPVEWLQWLTINTRFIIKSAMRPNPYDAVVKSIDQKVDPTSQKIYVRAEVTGPTEDLRPGMLGTAEFTPP